MFPKVFKDLVANATLFGFFGIIIKLAMCPKAFKDLVANTTLFLDFIFYLMLVRAHYTIM
jgi:hypothetical protein